MQTQKTYATFSLAELFNETKADNSILLVVDDPFTPVFNAQLDSWVVLAENFPAPDRVCLSVVSFHPDCDDNTIFARLKSGLYRIVGGNKGHHLGAFKRHDKRREAKKLAASSKNQLENMFELDVRAHLGGQ